MMKVTKKLEPTCTRNNTLVHVERERERVLVTLFGNVSIEHVIMGQIVYRVQLTWLGILNIG